MPSATQSSPTSASQPVVHSPSNSDLHSHTPLDRLVQHFLAAKRSLASTALVSRANELITGARAAVEEVATLRAKNGFVEQRVRGLAEILVAIRGGIASVGAEGREAFTTLLHQLDDEFMKLEKTLEVLRNTAIDPALQSPSKFYSPMSSTVNFLANSTEQAECSEKEIPRKRKGLTSSSTLDKWKQAQKKNCLYDFIDGSVVTTLQKELRASIDRFNEESAALEITLEEFDSTLSEINGAISSITKQPQLLRSNVNVRYNSPSASHEATNFKDPTPDHAIPAVFHTLESHATEMATSLQSLVCHFDLCVTALKHTEGGLPAATSALKLATNTSPMTPTGATDVNTMKANTSADLTLSWHQRAADVPAESISEEEKEAMLSVLESDAQEVDAVVSDLCNTLSYIVSVHTGLQSSLNMHRSHHEYLASLLAMLKCHAARIPGFIGVAERFWARWEEERSAIEAGMAEVEGLDGVLSGFTAAYKRLCVEVERRSVVEKRMADFVRQTVTKLAKLHQEEFDAREAFRAEQGDFLPSDIWPGLTSAPVQYEIRPVLDVQDEGEGEGWDRVQSPPL